MVTGGGVGSWLNESGAQKSSPVQGYDVGIHQCLNDT